jgi:hypothetical protein
MAIACVWRIDQLFMCLKCLSICLQIAWKRLIATGKELKSGKYSYIYTVAACFPTRINMLKKNIPPAVGNQTHDTRTDLLIGCKWPLGGSSGHQEIVKPNNYKID